MPPCSSARPSCHSPAALPAPASGRRASHPSFVTHRLHASLGCAGPPVVKSLHKAVPDAFLDCHLCTVHPANYVADLASAGECGRSLFFGKPWGLRWRAGAGLTGRRNPVPPPGCGPAPGTGTPCPMPISFGCTPPLPPRLLQVPRSSPSTSRWAGALFAANWLLRFEKKKLTLLQPAARPQQRLSQPGLPALRRAKAGWCLAARHMAGLPGGPRRVLPDRRLASLHPALPRRPLASTSTAARRPSWRRRRVTAACWRASRSRRTRSQRRCFRCARRALWTPCCCWRCGPALAGRCGAGAWAWAWGWGWGNKGVRPAGKEPGAAPSGHCCLAAPGDQRSTLLALSSRHLRVRCLRPGHVRLRLCPCPPQKFNPAVLPKVAALRSRFPGLNIIVDGGITLEASWGLLLAVFSLFDGLFVRPRPGCGPGLGAGRASADAQILRRHCCKCRRLLHSGACSMSALGNSLRLPLPPCRAAERGIGGGGGRQCAGGRNHRVCWQGAARGGLGSGHAPLDACLGARGWKPGGLARYSACLPPSAACRRSLHSQVAVPGLVSLIAGGRAAWPKAA